MKMQAIKLIVLRPFLHGYGVLSVGDALVTTPGHAKQLLHLGYAREGVVPERAVTVSTGLLAPGGALEVAPVLHAGAMTAPNPASGLGTSDDGGAPAEGATADASGSAISAEGGSGGQPAQPAGGAALAVQGESLKVPTAGSESPGVAGKPAARSRRRAG